MPKKQNIKVSMEINGRVASADLLQEIIGTQVEDRGYAIKTAKMKDGMCIYQYEITRGTGKGDVHSVNGTGIAYDDLNRAFEKFRVHLAYIDDSFKLQGVTIEDIDDYHNDDTTNCYVVTGFRIGGTEDSPTIVLVGNKFVSLGSRIELTSPKIPMDNLSSYPWHNELLQAAKTAQLEVSLYKEGKYEVVHNDEDEEEDNPRQMTIGDAIAESEAEAAGMEGEFENNKQ